MAKQKRYMDRCNRNDIKDKKMKFEVINDKGQVVMTTTSANCIPDKDVLNSMSKSGYKFRIDGKAVTQKKLSEMK